MRAALASSFESVSESVKYEDLPVVIDRDLALVGRNLVERRKVFLNREEREELMLDGFPVGLELVGPRELGVVEDRTISDERLFAKIRIE